MERYTKVNGINPKCMDKENLFILMAENIMVTLLKEQRTDKVEWNILITRCMMVNGKMENNTVLARSQHLMVELDKVFGKMVKELRIMTS